MLKIDEIASLSKLVSTNRIHTSDLLIEGNDSNSKIDKLFKLLVNKKKIDEDEIFSMIYEGDDNNWKSYLKLKERLRNKLINSIFLLNLTGVEKNKYDYNYIKCNKNLCAIRILINRRQRKLAIHLAEQTLTLAKRYEYLEIVVSLSRELVKHYLYFEKNNSKAKQYEETFKQYSEWLEQESHLDLIYSKLAQKVLYRNKNSSKELNTLKFELLQYRKLKNDTYKSNFFLFNALFFIAFLQKNIQNQKEVCKDAISFFLSKDNIPPTPIFSFYQKLGIAQMSSNEYDEALSSFQSCLDLNPKEGTINWYNILSYLMSINLYVGNFNQSYKFFAWAINHKSFKYLFDSFKENWVIREGYIHLLLKLEKIEQDIIEEFPIRNFRINRFLNEVPIYSKDKRGSNISILIIQMLFYLTDNKYNEFVDRMDALKQYSYRYLRNDETLRSNAFIKMILKIPDANWHPLRVQRHVEKYYKRLIATPMEISDQSAEVEIIPYEHLWELVLEILERDK